MPAGAGRPNQRNEQFRAAGKARGSRAGRRGVGGWPVPIRANYFVADLAVEMKLPVLVVAQNRLGCLNHTALTVRRLADHGLRCVGVVLNDSVAESNVATRTNADILRRIIPVPVVPGLTEKMDNLPDGWATVFEELSVPK